jgi:hypothetical protein
VSYYKEKQKMLHRFNTYWLLRIRAGHMITYDMIILEAEKSFACSVKPLYAYIKRLMLIDKTFREEGNYLVANNEQKE